MRTFGDREDAGRQLAAFVTKFRDELPVVIGLPRGGVAVAYQVAKALGAPLDVVVVRKIGAPTQPELAIGAVAEDNVVVLNQDLIEYLGISASVVDTALLRKMDEVEERVRLFRAARLPVSVKDRTVVLVDDGLATGATARAAIRLLRARGARRLILAVPVAAPAAVESMREEVDELICVQMPHNLAGIGEWYDDFRSVTDDEVIEFLTRAPERKDSVRRAVTISVESNRLPGDLTMPIGAHGLVIFAHGSGSSRHSPRNQFVARTLNDAGCSTLLFDLLSIEEAEDRANVFDILMLARRLVLVTQWAQQQPETRGLPIGYFGASTGAGAALWAAAELGDQIAAIVSRGGRPDMATGRLGAVHAPTLLIVGARDELVIEMNKIAQGELRCENELNIIPGATHLFSEPGALESVADLARRWFVAHFKSGRAAHMARLHTHDRRAR